MCDADDLWAPDRLERQAQALATHPEIGIAFGAVEIFGTATGPWGYLDITEAGMVEEDHFARALLRADVISTSTTLVAKRVYDEVGPFRERMGAEDYDYWLRALKAGAAFYYDPAALARYRRHSNQVTSSMLRVEQSGYEVRLSHQDLVADRRFIDALLGANLFNIGRLLADDGRRPEAREAFRRCLRHATPASVEIAARALVWVALLSLPRRAQLRGSEALVRLSRAFDGLRGGRPEMLP
jgi:glycosyltransferase involved in cell wall biosynthesis